MAKRTYVAITRTSDDEIVDYVLAADRATAVDAEGVVWLAIWRDKGCIVPANAQWTTNRESILDVKKQYRW